MQADDRALRRLQVAADTGGTMGFVFREARAERNPSPAALRIAIDNTSSDGGPRNCACSSAAARSRLRVRFPSHPRAIRASRAA